MVVENQRRLSLPRLLCTTYSLMTALNLPIVSKVSNWPGFNFNLVTGLLAVRRVLYGDWIKPTGWEDYWYRYCP